MALDAREKIFVDHADISIQKAREAYEDALQGAAGPETASAPLLAAGLGHVLDLPMLRGCESRRGVARASQVPPEVPQPHSDFLHSRMREKNFRRPCRHLNKRQGGHARMPFREPLAQTRPLHLGRPRAWVTRSTCPCCGGCRSRGGVARASRVPPEVPQPHTVNFCNENLIMPKQKQAPLPALSKPHWLLRLRLAPMSHRNLQWTHSTSNLSSHLCV